MQTKFVAATIACCSIVLAGCQEYDFDFTSEEIFRGAYERNFTDCYGEIDPDETWDLSDAGGRRGHSGAVTRARAEYESVASSDGWYYVQDGTLSWMKQQLPEQTNSKSKINAFAMTWTKGVEFEIVPIYEGLAHGDSRCGWYHHRSGSVDQGTGPAGQRHQPLLYQLDTHFDPRTREINLGLSAQRKRSSHLGMEQRCRQDRHLLYWRY